MRKFKQEIPFVLIKKFCLNGFFAVLTMAFSMSACSDDDNDEAAAAFPAKQTVSCKEGETKELTFDVSANWQLTSSATWCRFVADGVEDYSLSGSAGKQTVTLKITNESLKFDESTVAQLVMIIGANKAIVADVVRDNKDRSLKIYDMDGNEIQQIEVGYADYLSFTVEANFHFAATNRPEWLDIAGNAIVGSANKSVTGRVKIVDDAQFVKYVQNGELTFADENGIESYTFPLVYKGMNPETIIIQNANPWNWEVTLDGKTFTQTSSSGASGTTSTSTYNNFVPVAIQALNDDFVPVYIQKVVEYGMTQMRISGEDDVDWMHLDDKSGKGDARLTVDATAEEREGYVLVFPRAEYDKIKGDLWGNLIEMDMETYEPDIKYTYQQNNLVMHVIQKEKKQVVEQAFKVTYLDPSAGWATVEVECTKVTDADILAEYQGINDVYTMEWPSNNSFEVDPLEGDFGENWYYQLMRDGKDITSEDIVEPMEKSCNFFLSDPSSLAEPLHLLIMKNDEIVKVLIITSRNN